MATNRHHIRLLVLLAASLHFLPPARADDTVRDQILKKRDAVLSEILAGREQRFAIGGGDAEAVLAARLALLSFRRDAAPAAGDKARQQELIVDLWRQRLATIEGQAKTGAAGRETILLATESMLQAEQLLEELRAQPTQK